MHTEFWNERWRNNEIGFHRNDVNPWLLKYWSTLSHGQVGTVFVPLCGKTLDMAWLAGQAHNVMGVECSKLAIKDFFLNQKWHADTEESGKFSRWSNNKVSIFLGDFFDLEAQMLTDVKVVYDRASLVAFPKEMRADYVKHLVSILPKSAKIFLISLEYPQEQMSGPPFSVPETEVMSLYAKRFHVEKLDQHSLLTSEPRWNEKGLTSMTEKVFLLTPKNAA